jgi:hypothetical protein
MTLYDHRHTPYPLCSIIPDCITSIVALAFLWCRSNESILVPSVLGAYKSDECGGGGKVITPATSCAKIIIIVTKT